MRPVPGYHGAKWRIADWIVSHMPPHRTYVEPFGGSAAVLFNKRPAPVEIYNDLNGWVVNFFRVLRDPVQGPELIRLLELTPNSREEFQGAYEPSEDPVELARRTAILAFFGRGYRGASNPGHRTGFKCYSDDVSSTARRWDSYPDHLRSILGRLKGVVIECRPALEIISMYDGPETLFYVDPPYLPETRTANQPYTHDMTLEDHHTLVSALRQVDGMVCISGYSTGQYADWLSGWRMASRPARADKAKAATECIWMNYSAGQQRMFA